VRLDHLLSKERLARCPTVWWGCRVQGRPVGTACVPGLELIEPWSTGYSTRPGHRPGQYYPIPFAGEQLPFFQGGSGCGTFGDLGSGGLNTLLGPEETDPSPPFSGRSPLTGVRRGGGLRPGQGFLLLGAGGVGFFWIRDHGLSRAFFGLWCGCWLFFVNCIVDASIFDRLLWSLLLSF
jgi:hypothetical protein